MTYGEESCSQVMNRVSGPRQEGSKRPTKPNKLETESYLNKKQAGSE